MANTLIDLQGLRFGRILVLRRAKNDSRGAARWHCKCKCGTNWVVLGANIRRGLTQSCGCLKRDLQLKHGKLGTPLYRIWQGMKRRCLATSVRSYQWYGARGITIHPSWLKFENFHADILSTIGDRPSNPDGWISKKPYYSLDRIDNDGNYEPGNVRWETPKNQTINRRAAYLNESGVRRFLDDNPEFVNRWLTERNGKPF